MKKRSRFCSKTLRKRRRRRPAPRDAAAQRRHRPRRPALDPPLARLPRHLRADAAARPLRHAAAPRASSAGLEPAAAAAPHASAFAAARRLRRDEALAPRADPPPVTAAATPTAAPLAVPSRDGRRAGAGKFAPPATPAGGYFIVIGFPIGIDERNCDRRALLRELVPEYDNIGKTVRVEFVIGLLTYQGDGHEVRGARLDSTPWLDAAVPHRRCCVCCCAWSDSSGAAPPSAGSHRERAVFRTHRARRPGARQRARSHARPLPRRPKVHRREDCGLVPAGGGDAPQDAVSCDRRPPATALARPRLSACNWRGAASSSRPIGTRGSTRRGWRSTCGCCRIGASRSISATRCGARMLPPTTSRAATALDRCRPRERAPRSARRCRAA